MTDRPGQADTSTFPVTPAMIVAGVCAREDWLERLPPDLWIRQLSLANAGCRDALQESVFLVYVAMIRQKLAHEST